MIAMEVVGASVDVELGELEGEDGLSGESSGALYIDDTTFDIGTLRNDDIVIDDDGRVERCAESVSGLILLRVEAVDETDGEHGAVWDGDFLRNGHSGRAAGAYTTAGCVARIA